MNRALIATGHGYEAGSRGRCTAFDGFEIIAHPLPGDDAKGRDSRVFGRKDNGYGGTCYAAYQLRLATSCGGLYLLVSHGGGREVWAIPAFFDNGATKAAILAMPERVQFGLLMTLYKAMRDARAEALAHERRNWSEAFLEGRIKKRRAARGMAACAEIQPRVVQGQTCTIDLGGLQ